MALNRLLLSLRPAFDEQCEIELILDRDGDAYVGLLSDSLCCSAQVPRECAESLMIDANALIRVAKTEELRGSRDGIDGRLLLETAGHPSIEVEFWSPFSSDASHQLISKVLTLLEPLFASPDVSSHFRTVKSYLR